MNINKIRFKEILRSFRNLSMEDIIFDFSMKMLDLQIRFPVLSWERKNSAEQRGFFSWRDVKKSRKNKELQQRRSLVEAKATYLVDAKPCPVCKKTPDELTWIYFRSPNWTWRKMCGREGWLTICETCERQVNFFMTLMN